MRAFSDFFARVVEGRKGDMKGVWFWGRLREVRKARPEGPQCYQDWH